MGPKKRGLVTSPWPWAVGLAASAIAARRTIKRRRVSRKSGFTGAPKQTIAADTAQQEELASDDAHLECSDKQKQQSKAALARAVVAEGNTRQQDAVRSCRGQCNGHCKGQCEAVRAQAAAEHVAVSTNPATTGSTQSSRENDSRSQQADPQNEEDSPSRDAQHREEPEQDSKPAAGNEVDAFQLGTSDFDASDLDSDADSVVGSDISSEEGSDTESFHSCLTDSSDDLDSDNDDFEEVGVSKEEDRRSKKDHEEASSPEDRIPAFRSGAAGTTAQGADAPSALNLKPTGVPKLNLTSIKQIEVALTERGLKAQKMAICQGKLSEVFPGLFLGDSEAADNLKLLRKKGVTHVVNCAAGQVPNFFPAHFNYKSWDMQDNGRELLRSKFDETFQHIQEARDNGGSALIHCQQGASRSASFVIGYIMRETRLPYEEVFEMVKEAHLIASPHLGFYFKLKAYERELGIVS